MELLKHYISTSRPITWVIHINMVLIGAIVAGEGSINDFVALVPLLILFSLPYSAVIFGVNDYYDYESDVANLRKGGFFGEKHNLDHKKRLLLYTWISSLVGAILLIPYFSLELLVIYLLMTANFYFYSSPPFRFKSFPIIDFVSGGFFYAVPICVMGFIAGGGELAAFTDSLVSGISVVLIVSTVSHIMAALLDRDADKLQGLKTTPIKVGYRNSIYICLSMIALGGYVVRNNWFLLTYLVFLFVTVASFLITDGKKSLPLQITISKYFTVISSVLGVLVALIRPELFI